jgi:DNA-binding beta-propeller fold protein YncE
VKDSGRLLVLTALLAGSALFCAGLAGTAAASDPLAHASIGFQPTPVTLATDPAGNVLVSNGHLSGKMKEFSADGSPLRSFGSFQGEIRPIATDPAGDLWMLEDEGGKMLELDRSGRVTRSWPAQGLGMAIAPDGDVFTVGSGGVAHYTADGTLVARWSLPGGGSAWALAVGPEGLVYVANATKNEVQVFESGGAFVREWPTSADFGSYALPYGIAVSPSGQVYVDYAGGDRVDEFTTTGTLIRSWGSAGNGHGHFETPTGIAIGPEGSVYVADEATEYPGPGTARVQKFTAEGQFVTEFGYIPRPPPPRPRLIAKPPRRTTSQTATFSFSSPQKGVAFECKLSGRSVPKKLRHFRRCSSPRRYAHLGPGRKTFEVFAVNSTAAGSSARYAWSVVSG